MSIVNFNISTPLEQKIEYVIKKQGISSKAEFFRFAAIYYIHTLGNDISQMEYEDTIRSLKEVLHKKINGKKLHSLKEQLENL